MCASSYSPVLCPSDQEGLEADCPVHLDPRGRSVQNRALANHKCKEAIKRNKFLFFKALRSEVVCSCSFALPVLADRQKDTVNLVATFSFPLGTLILARPVVQWLPCGTTNTAVRPHLHEQWLCCCIVMYFLSFKQPSTCSLTS